MEKQVNAETIGNTPETRQEVSVNELPPEISTTEQISNIDSRISIYSVGAENDRQRIDEVRAQLGLTDETEEAPSILAQKEEERKLQERKDEMEQKLREEEKQKRIEELAEKIFNEKLLAYRNETESKFINGSQETSGASQSDNSFVFETESEENIIARLKEEALAEATQKVEQEKVDEKKPEEEKKDEPIVNEEITPVKESEGEKVSKLEASLVSDSSVK